MRNRRGTHGKQYRCSCDFRKVGTVDCKHFYAEKRRRGDISARAVQVELQSEPSESSKSSDRRPRRKRLAVDGRTVETTQRIASGLMEKRVPELLGSLMSAYSDAEATGEAPTILARPSNGPGGRPPVPIVARLIALLLKIAAGSRRRRWFRATKPTLRPAFCRSRRRRARARCRTGLTTTGSPSSLSGSSSRR